jgi:ferrous iron transport protein B
MEHCGGSPTITEQKGRSIVLVGNPNVGKSVLFEALTGHYVTVSNYPGTTVEIFQGAARFSQACVVDTPGLNTLLARSEEERVTRRLLLDDGEKVVVQVADARNLRRALLLSLQLAELGVPFLLAANMLDEARGINIDEEKLSRILGVDVIGTIATRGYGLERLLSALKSPRRAEYRVRYDPPIEEALAEIAELLEEGGRARALLLLVGDDEALEGLDEDLRLKVTEIRERVQARYHEPLGYVIHRRLLAEADEILAQVCSRGAQEAPSWGERLGRFTTHPLWGVPVLLGVLYLIYQFVGVFGAQTLVGLLEEVVFGEWINPWATRLINQLNFPLLSELLVGPYGLITMALTYGLAIILPIVATFFLAFGILEDSGYLPRLAVMLNRAFRAMGLHGKAVLPMLLGLGCVTMATMTARVLETRKEKVLMTLLLALGVPCSAQLGVILGLMGSLGPKALLIWGGVVVMVLFSVGFLAARLLPGRSSDFILELPPLRVPRPSNLALKTFAHLEWYLKEVIPLFILGTLVLFTLDKLSWLGGIERLASPLVVGFLGLPKEATAAFLLGFLRRDYGAAGLFALALGGKLDPIQATVALVTITLFVPCIANLFMIIKERGLRTAIAIVGFIFPLAFLVGGLLNMALRGLGVGL